MKKHLHVSNYSDLGEYMIDENILRTFRSTLIQILVHISGHLDVVSWYKDFYYRRTEERVCHMWGKVLIILLHMYFYIKIGIFTSVVLKSSPHLSYVDLVTGVWGTAPILLSQPSSLQVMVQRHTLGRICSSVTETKHLRRQITAHMLPLKKQKLHHQLQGKEWCPEKNKPLNKNFIENLLF